MSDLRKAAEIALSCLNHAVAYDRKEEQAIKKAIQALRQALDDKPAVKTYAGGKPNYCTPEVTGEVPCKTHPDAQHGFDRNASHAADRYVCECEGWEPVDAVDTSQESVDETAKGEHEPIDWEAVAADQAMTIAMMKLEKRDSSSWVGLTADEIWKCNKAETGSAVEFHICVAHQHVLDFAEAIEAKLREKNGG